MEQQLQSQQDSSHPDSCPDNLDVFTGQEPLSGEFIGKINKGDDFFFCFLARNEFEH